MQMWINVQTLDTKVDFTNAFPGVRKLSDANTTNNLYRSPIHIQAMGLYTHQTLVSMAQSLGHWCHKKTEQVYKYTQAAKRLSLVQETYWFSYLVSTRNYVWYHVTMPSQVKYFGENYATSVTPDACTFNLGGAPIKYHWLLMECPFGWSSLTEVHRWVGASCWHSII